DETAGIDEERDLDSEAVLELGFLHDVAGAADGAFRGGGRGDAQADVREDIDGLAIDEHGPELLAFLREGSEAVDDDAAADRNVHERSPFARAVYCARSAPRRGYALTPPSAATPVPIHPGHGCSVDR